MTLHVPVIRQKMAKAWPKHERGAAATYISYTDALTMDFEKYEAFTCAYSVPDVKRRLAGDAYEHVEGGVKMQLLLLDIDAPAHAKTDSWAKQTRGKISDMFKVHPGGFCAESKNGFRIYYPLSEPLFIADRLDKLKWTQFYTSVLNYVRLTFGLTCDEKCSDWCRLQRLPHDTREGVLQKLPTFGDSTGGKGFSLPSGAPQAPLKTPASAPERSPSTGKSGGGSVPVSKKLIRNIIKDLGPYDKVGIRLQNVLDGVSWASDGDRDSGAMKMTWAIATKTQELDPQGVTLLFQESLTRMQADDPEFSVDAGDMYARACVKVEHELSLRLADSRESRRSGAEVNTMDPETVQHDLVIKALAQDESLYSLCGEVVQVVDNEIRSVPPGMFATLISSVVQYVGAKGNNSQVPQHVIKSAFSAIHRPGWKNILGTKEGAALRPDGTVQCTEGYDPLTEVYVVDPVGQFDRMDLVDAVNVLAEPFQDFDFAQGGLAGCISCILTLIARDILYDIGASVPAFIFTAPDSGSGKTTLAEMCQIIAGVSEPSTMAYVHDRGEMEKRYQAHIMGDNVCMFVDNWPTGGVVGGPMLDAMVTCKKRLQVRDFGKLRNTSRPWRSTIMITGNQLQVRGDFTRRVVYIQVGRKPSDYAFAIRDLRTHVMANRAKYLNAATSILSHHMDAGNYDMEGKASYDFASFQAWVSLVGGAVMRAGFGDPCEGRQVLDDSNDDDDLFIESVQALADIWPEGDWFRAKDLLDIPEAEAVFTELESCFLHGRLDISSQPMTVRRIGSILAKLNASKAYLSVGEFVGIRDTHSKCRVWNFTPAEVEEE